MKKAHYEETTQKLLGWYDDTIHTTIPTPTIEVSEADYQTAINNSHNKVKLDGTTYLVDFRTDEELIQDAKELAEQRIKDGFENELLNGRFQSTVANLTVDNRRSGSKADRDNLDALIFLGNYPILWKCVDGIFSIPDAITAETLKTEMINAGLANYQNKWVKEQSIMDAVTAAEYESIVW